MRSAARDLAERPERGPEEVLDEIEIRHVPDLADQLVERERAVIRGH
jgi:hypothetical protein